MSIYNDKLGMLESSNRYNIENDHGYLGKYQLGADALYDLGVVARKPSNVTNKAWLSDSRNWLPGMNKEKFLNSPEIQEQTIEKWNRLLDVRAKYYGLDSFYGKEMNGLVLTQDGLRAASHLLGSKQVSELLKSGDLTAASDANATTARDYVSKFQPTKEVGTMTTYNNGNVVATDGYNELGQYRGNGDTLTTPYENTSQQLPTTREEERMWHEAANTRALNSDPFSEYEWYDTNNFQEKQGRRNIIGGAAGTFMITRLMGALAGVPASEARSTALREAALSFGNDVAESYRYNQRNVALAQGNTQASVQKWIRSGNDKDLEQDKNRYLRGKGAQLQENTVAFFTGDQLPAPMEGSGQTTAPRDGFYLVLSDPYTGKVVKVMFKEPFEEEGEKQFQDRTAIRTEKAYLTQGDQLPAPLDGTGATTAPKTGWYTFYYDSSRSDARVVRVSYTPEFKEETPTDKKLSVEAKVTDQKLEDEILESLLWREQTARLANHPGLKNISNVESLIIPNLTQEGRDAQALVDAFSAQIALANRDKMQGVLTDTDMILLERIDSTLKSPGLSLGEKVREINKVIERYNLRIAQKWKRLSESGRKNLNDLMASSNEFGFDPYTLPEQEGYRESATTDSPRLKLDVTKPQNNNVYLSDDALKYM